MMPMPLIGAPAPPSTITDIIGGIARLIIITGELFLSALYQRHGRRRLMTRVDEASMLFITPHGHENSPANIRATQYQNESRFTLSLGMLRSREPRRRRRRHDGDGDAWII